MTYTRFVALSALALGLPLAACGSYSDDNATTSTTGSTATTATTTSATTGGLETTTSPATTATVGTTGSTTATVTATATVTTGGGDTTTGAGGASATTGTSTTGAIEASCDNVTACGGDLVGTWAVAGSCLAVSGMADLTGFGLNCTAAPTEGTLEVSGTISFGADGKVTDMTTTRAMATATIPPECLTISGTTTTCDRMDDPLLARGYTTVECLDDEETGGCNCTASAEQSGAMAFLTIDYWASANYTTADNTVTLSVFGDPWEYAYCVEDTTLTISTQSVSKIGTLTGTVALLKQ